VDIGTSQGPARADLVVPGSGSPSFLLVLTHGAGGSAGAPDLLAVREAALQMGAATALVTQPYRVKGARAPGSPARQDEAWREIIAFLRETLGANIPLIVGGRSNGARVACRTAAAVGARGVIALAYPLRPPGHRAAAGRARTTDPAARAGGLRPADGSAGTNSAPTRAAELRMAAAGGARVLVVNGDRDPFGIPDPGDALRVVVLKGETHALSRNPAAVARAVTGWLREVVPLVR